MSPRSKLEARPLHLKEANRAVALWHRHCDPVRFHLFSIGAYDDEHNMRGAIIVMRPVNQHRSWGGLMVEVSRLSTDGCQNACSFLLSRAARAAFAMGYACMQTYTLLEEPGTSLRASGWMEDGITSARDWNGSRRRPRALEPSQKRRWILPRPDAWMAAQKAAAIRQLPTPGESQ